MAQAILLGEQVPHLSTPAFGHAYKQRTLNGQVARSGQEERERDHWASGSSWTALTLAKGVIHFLLVPLDLGSAGDAELLLPHCLDLFGALAHLLVVKFHLSDVQFISAGCQGKESSHVKLIWQ